MVTNPVLTGGRPRGLARVGLILTLAVVGAALLSGVAAAEAKRPIWGFHASWTGYCYSHLEQKVTRRVHGGRSCLLWERRVRPQEQIARAAETGARTVRINTPWTEGVRHAKPPRRGESYPYRWSDLDLRYWAARGAGMRPIIVILGAPAWARRPGWRHHCPGHFPLKCAYPPRRDTLGNFRRWTEALMRRYPRALAVEVWNEPNGVRFWPPRPAPRLYSQLLRRVHRARIASGFRGSIVLGGLAPARDDGAGPERDSAFLNEVYRSARKRWFDGIGHHPYPFVPERPADGWVAGMDRHLERILRVRDRHGHPRAELWLTELGVAGGGGGWEDRTVHPTRQGPILERLYEAAARRPVRAITFYTFADLPFEGSRWERFGVVDPQLRPKPAFCHLRQRLGALPAC